MINSPNLLTVDWSKIPAPSDDGACRHISGMAVPPMTRSSTGGTDVDLAALKGRTVLYVYPLTGRPDVALPEGWDGVPGARGCTPQSCAFRDHFDELRRAGAHHVFGMSTQATEYQHEAAQRLHLPFALISDWDLSLTHALGLPTFTVDGDPERRTLLKRLSLVIDDGQITKVFYPVFPPDQNAADVLAWLIENPARETA